MMTTLYPPLEPYQSGTLAVSDLHTLYWEECGNPYGVPVVFLHGGPGAGSSPSHRRFFDPHHYRIIIFDQRGSGRSRPLGETRDNTTEHLISDLEVLRSDRGIRRWHIFGGSWGSTLALAYAEAYPTSCLSLTLRGICLLQKREIQWFLYGLQNVFPEAWQTFSNHIPENQRHDLLGAYTRLFQHQDRKLALDAMRIWTNYETACSTLLPHTYSGPEDDIRSIGMATLEAHYFLTNLFNPDNKLLLNANRIRNIPGTIVQGRYDMICPIITADELHRAWPEASYIIVPNAGHSAMEEGITEALVKATDNYRTIIN